MPHETITRYFHHNSANGMFCAGFLDHQTIPGFFSLESPAIVSSSCYHCLLVTNGTLCLALSDSSLSSLYPGTVFQQFPDTDFPALISFSKDVCLYQVTLGNFTHQALAAANLLCSETIFQISIEPYLKNWMPALIDQLKKTPQTELSEAYLNTQKFLISLHKENTAHSNEKKILFTESAKQLLLDGCLSEINFQQIADSLGVSYEAFRKNFKEVTGQSPLQFVLENKFRYAQRFLTEGMSVKEAAMATGYTDPYIFSKQFKKYVGVPPSHYKPER